MAMQVEFCMRQNVSINGTAAVVDGSQVLLTPLQRAVVPPPMCAVAASFHGGVQCLAFGDHQGNEVRAVVPSPTCVASNNPSVGHQYSMGCDSYIVKLVIPAENWQPTRQCSWTL